jgi:hypothetical protein
MTTGTGNSFADNANKLTNALRYNASNGAGLRLTGGTVSGLLNIGVGSFTMSKLMLKQDINYATVVTFNPSAGSVIDQCIIQSAGTATGLVVVGGMTVKNTLVLCTDLANGVSNGADNNAFQDVTIVTNSAGTGKTGFARSYGSPTLRNVVVAGFATDYSGTAGTCANNATDKGAFGGTNYGTSGQVSVVQATEFQNVSAGTEDYRVKQSTSVKLQNNGTATGTPITDIVGQFRPATPTIGAWEANPAATPPFPFPFSPRGPL